MCPCLYVFSQTKYWSEMQHKLELRISTLFLFPISRVRCLALVLYNAASAEQVFWNLSLYNFSGCSQSRFPHNNLNFFMTFEMSFLGTCFLRTANNQMPGVAKSGLWGWVWNSFKSDTVLEGSDDGVWHLNSWTFSQLLLYTYLNIALRFGDRFNLHLQACFFQKKCHDVILIYPLIDPD